MSTASGPPSPADDLAAWRARSDEDRVAGALTPDLCALAQGGVAISLGTRRPEGRPLAGAGVACRVRPGGVLRILLSRAANAKLLDAVEAGARLAVTFSRARDHRAFR